MLRWFDVREDIMCDVVGLTAMVERVGEVQDEADISEVLSKRVLKVRDKDRSRNLSDLEKVVHKDPAFYYDSCPVVTEVVVE
jgi:hypothetical protein